MRRRYPTDLTDAEWECIEPHIRSPNKRGRPKIYSLRHVLDAVFYLLKGDCAWRLLPREFPPGGTVCYWFRKWRIDACSGSADDGHARPLASRRRFRRRHCPEQIPPFPSKGRCPPSPACCLNRARCTPHAPLRMMDEPRFGVPLPHRQLQSVDSDWTLVESRLLGKDVCAVIRALLAQRSPMSPWRLRHGWRTLDVSAPAPQ
jgi:transposase